MYLWNRERFPGCITWWWLPISYLSSTQKQGNLPYTQSCQVEDGACSHMNTRLVPWNQNFIAAGSAGRGCAAVSCSILHFQSLFNHTWSLFCLCKGLYCSKKHAKTPLFHTPKRASRDANIRIMENDRSAKKTLLSNKEEQRSSYFSWILHCLEYFLQRLNTVSLFPCNCQASFPSHRSIQQNLSTSEGLGNLVSVSY